jgi:hypothetical protein
MVLRITIISITLRKLMVITVAIIIITIIIILLTIETMSGSKMLLIAMTKAVLVVEESVTMVSRRLAAPWLDISVLLTPAPTRT